MNYYGNPYNPYSSAPNQLYGAQQQFQPTNTNKMFVGGIAEIKAKILPPNSDWVFLDRDKSVIYNTTVNANGQISIKAYDITEKRDQEQEKVQQSIDLSAYVKKGEIEALQGEIQALKDAVAKISKETVITNGSTR